MLALTESATSLAVSHPIWLASLGAAVGYPTAYALLRQARK